MAPEILKTTINRTTNTLLKVAAISTALLGIFGIWSFYKNDIWKPTITIKDVDFVKGVANLNINGKDFVLKGDSTYLIAYNWGIRFGYTYNQNSRSYDRIELTKNGMVKQVIK
jgi:hypothetical protein